MRVRASDDAELPTPQQQQPQQGEETGISGRRLLLLAGASAVASAVPTWLSLAWDRGSGGSATPANEQVRQLLLSTVLRLLHARYCALVPVPEQMSTELQTGLLHCRQSIDNCSRTDVVRRNHTPVYRGNVC